MSDKKKIIHLAKSRATALLDWSALVLNQIFADHKGREALLNAIDQIPLSNGSRYYQAQDVRLGIVADPFVLQNYGPTCNLISLTPDNWQELLPTVDCLLITSAWQGAAGEWAGLGRMSSPLREVLLTLMRQAKAGGCPVLFYSKEDPPNYSVFLDFAREADHIFTSAKECVVRYQTDCPGIPVDVLSFAVNPQLHNPLGSCSKKWENAILFAGSWMVKYPQRIQSMEQMFRMFRSAGLRLCIADRNFSRSGFRYRYPLRYLRYVVGDFRYDQLSRVYKCFPWCMNINSVTDSHTMFAMRVYDVLACGTQILSNDSLGVAHQFPEVHLIQNQADLDRVLALPETALAANRKRGIRHVLRQTVFEKMAYVLEQAGLAVRRPMPRKVGVLLAANLSKAQETRLKAMFEAQTYPNKTLIHAGDAGDWDMLCLWGPDREYDRHYLEDMINGFKYTNCDYVAAPWPDQAGDLYTDRIADRYGVVFWATVMTPERLAALPAGEIPFPNGCTVMPESPVHHNHGETT